MRRAGEVDICTMQLDEFFFRIIKEMIEFTKKTWQAVMSVGRKPLHEQICYIRIQVFSICAISTFQIAYKREVTTVLCSHQSMVKSFDQVLIARKCLHFLFSEGISEAIQWVHVGMHVSSRKFASQTVRLMTRN